MMIAGVLDVLQVVVGVISALVGLGLVLLGLIALTEKAPKQGAGTLLVGLGFAALGLWLIGVL